MAFCTNCGAALPENARFCPECGTSTASSDALSTVETVNAYTTTVPVSSTISPVFSTAGIGNVTGYNVVLVSTGTTDVNYADDLLSDLLGYSLTQSQTLVSNVPTLVAQSLTRKQALYVVQALTEYGMEAAAYDSNGYVDFDEEASSTIFKSDGSILSKVAAILGTITLANRVSRLIRWNTPSCLERIFRPRYSWNKPPHVKKRFKDVPRVQRPAPAKKPAPARPAGQAHGSERPGGGHDAPHGQHNAPGQSGGSRQSQGRPGSGRDSHGTPGGHSAPNGKGSHGGPGGGRR